MKKFIICLCFPALCVQAQPQQLKLWYDAPARIWTDALPIGNGRLGAMVFGGASHDRIQFNEETLWTGAPRDYNRKGAYAYLPEIRKLLAEGKQADAEKLAGDKFMGTLSAAGDRDRWRNGVLVKPGDKRMLPDYDDGNWKTMKVPSYDGWEAAGFDGLDGAVWLRTTVDVPANWAGNDLVLDLNRIRDEDFTYVNGELIGSMSNNDARKYTVPGRLVRPGRNTIAVYVLNYFDKGGIQGYKDTTRAISVFPKTMPREKPVSLVKKWKYEIVDNEPPATARYQADYQPFGDLFLDFDDAPVRRYRRDLDLEKAIATTSYEQNGVAFKREYFVSQPDQAAVIHVSADKARAVSFSAGLGSPHTSSSVRRVGPATIALSVRVKNGALKGESYLRAVVRSGSVRVINNKLVIAGADEVTLYLTAATNYKNYKDVSGDAASLARSPLAGIAGRTYASVKQRHEAEYARYFDTFSVSFGPDTYASMPTDKRIAAFATHADPAFAALYLQYGRYLLISSSRPGTRPANLQGIWNDLLLPPWGSKYTTNINAEMNYWPAESLNLSACEQPLFAMIGELAEAGRETAREYYDAPGWVEHHNTDLWRGTAAINASNHGIWVTGGAWLCSHLWEHFQFTRDTAFLRQTAYPLMRDAALFFDTFLVKDPKTGWLISTPSNSPEHGGLVAGPTMDHQIIRALFKSCSEAAAILHTDEGLAAWLKQKSAQIAPNQVGKFGQLQEWLEDKDDTTDTHRHVSHLWAVYPGSEINWDQTPDLMKAARQSLLYRGDLATGWSLAWKLNLWARFKDGDHAWDLLKTLLRPVGNPDGGGGSYVNLFDAHPPFQIDGNFGGAAGIGELLVQSHEGYIDLLPALPKALPTGSVRGICARGGFVLNLDWAGGRLREVQLITKTGGPCRLKYLGHEQAFTAEKGRVYRFSGTLAPL